MLSDRAQLSYVTTSFGTNPRLAFFCKESSPKTNTMDSFFMLMSVLCLHMCLRQSTIIARDHKPWDKPLAGFLRKESFPKTNTMDSFTSNKLIGTTSKNFLRPSYRTMGKPSKIALGDLEKEHWGERIYDTFFYCYFTTNSRLRLIHSTMEASG